MAETRPAAFAADVREAMVRNLRLAGGVGVVIVPAFALLDRVMAPTHATEFLGYRLAAAVLLAAIVGLTWTRAGRVAIVPLGYGALLVAALPVSVMVARLDPGVTPYYAGLDLAMLFNGLLFPWRPVHTLAVNLVLVLSFLAPVVAAGGPSDPSAFANNSFFILATGAVSSLSSWVLHREHRRRFDLSWSLEAHSRELAEANDRLRELDEAKTRFFANVSHELRTPLTLALAPIDAARTSPGMPRPAREMLDSLVVDLRVMSRRINDLIDLARLDSGAFPADRRPVDVVRIVREVVVAAGGFARTHQVRLEMDLDDGLPPALGDARMVEQICFNLVSNALKFTPPLGRVSVAVSAGGRGLRIEVADTGPGIDEADQKDLFTRFGRSTETSTGRGAGLGLALVKEFAELLGGSVVVRSRRGEGASFTVELPAASPEQVPRELPRTAIIAEAFATEMAEKDIEPGSIPQDERPLVLVVDDNVRLRQLVGRVLGPAFRVAEARDGQEALRRMEEAEPCVVVTDVMMPGIDGIALLGLIRERPAWATLPVLLLTAWDDDEVRQRALELGATDFVGKPFSPRELRARVANFVALRRAERQLQESNGALAASLQATQAAQVRAARAEKLASIGQLAAGIAHEVKNPVNYILNFARPSESRLGELAEGLDGEGADTAQQLREVLGRIIDGAERIETIVNGLQAFARGGEARVPVRFDREVEAALRMVRSSLPSGVLLVAELACPGTIHGSPVAVGAVVVNLVSNAARAVGPGGRVWVRSRAEADAVVLEVEDDGVGIAPEHLDRIWDPFFTTRAPGEGLGLGLALVHRIVTDDLGGRIEVESTPGVGTRFTVTVPRFGASTSTGPWADLAGTA